jgi:DNA-binding GntR family transcriptional regulator
VKREEPVVWNAGLLGEGVLAQARRRPQTAAEFVAETLRRSILSGELSAGTRLGLAEVAAGMEVSTTPVREALRELSFEGLVQFDSYRGGTVNAVTVEDMREIVRIRQVLEPLAVREAMENMTPEILAQAEAVLHRMDPSAGGYQWVEDNREYHSTFYQASPSKRLIAMISSLQDLTVMFVSNALDARPLLVEQAHHDHGELLEAFQSGDVERAVSLTLEHLALPFAKL